MAEKMTKLGHIRRGTRVHVTLTGNVVNAIYAKDELIGYRVNRRGFWVVVPAECVEV